jgi:hypothetical protein
MAFLRYLVLASVMVSFVSCAGPRVRVPEPKPYEGPVDVEVLKSFRVFKDVTSVRSEVRVKIKRGKKRLGTLKGSLIFHEPDYFRLRVYSPIGTAGMDLLHADGMIQAYVPDEGVIYEGPSPATKKELRFRMEENDNEYILYALKTEEWGTKIHASYEYDHRTLINKKLTVYNSGEKFVDMSFKDFLGTVPLRARFELMEGYTMYLDLLAPEINVDVSPELFEFMDHGGLTVLPLERIMREPR